MTQRRFSLSPEATERWAAIGVVTLVAWLAYGPLLPWLGFYRDDWYQLWAGTTLGPRSIVTLFSIDRPVMGYFYAAAFSVLRDSALAWQLYALFLRWLGAMGALWLFRKLWPGRPLITTSAALLFLVYPGFQQQPNANTFSNHLLGYAAGIWSLAATAESLQAPSGRRRTALVAFAVASALVCWLIYEYMIGLELLRYILFGRAALKATGRFNTQWLTRFLVSAAPFLVAMLAFLFWRFFVFQATRSAVDVGKLVEQYRSAPGGILLERAATLIGDFVEASFFGWFVPSYERLSALEAGKVVVGLLPAGAAVLLFVWFARKWRADRPPSASGPSSDPARDLILLGGLTTVGCLAPVVLAGREVRWSSAFDRYTLQATIGLAMLTVGLLWTAFHARARPAAIAFFLGLSVLAHQANGFQWARFWEEQRQLWWQLSWRAPALQPGTVLLVNLPSQRYFEDYEVWGPANMIYAPGDKSPDLAAEVLAEETAPKVRLGSQETRYMRVLIGIPRDYRNTLIVDWPSREACVHVLGAGQPEAALTSASLVRSLAGYSREELVLTTPAPVRPAERVFGSEPDREWCWLYQQASLARQQRDWGRARDLAEEAGRLGLAPSDRSEWMPFFQGSLNAGDQDEGQRVADLIRQDRLLAQQLCDRLMQEHFSDQETYRQAQLMLCGQPE